jgi:hypothetical protein
MPGTGTPDGAAAGSDAAATGADTAAAPVDGPSPDLAAAPVPDLGTGACGLDRSYEFYLDGGLRVFQDKSKLSPPRQHGLTRDRRGGTLLNCTRTFTCATADALTLAIAHPDVVEALKLAMPPHYGGDPRPVDGTIFVFRRDDGRGFSVGPGNVPAGVRALETLLNKVYEESLASPECAALR